MKSLINILGKGSGLPVSNSINNFMLFRIKVFKKRHSLIFCIKDLKDIINVVFAKVWMLE